MSKITKKQQVLNHFLKHPLATPRVVSEKFSMAMPAVYTLRKQAMKEYQERNAAEIQPVEKSESSASHMPQAVQHWSDCAVNNGPAYPAGECNCGGNAPAAQASDHPLYPVLMDAIKQAMFGKGERHGGAVTPFQDQPWAHYAKMHGRGFLTGQAAKKLEEAASTRTGAAFEQEVLGAIVYCGMALLKERGQV